MVRVIQSSVEKIKPYLIGAIAGGALVALLLCAFVCNRPAEVITLPGRATGITDTSYVLSGVPKYDSARKAYVIHDTIITHRTDTLLFFDTIFVGEPIAGHSNDTVPHKLANFKWLPSLAQPIIAAFRPQTPRQFLEVYAKIGSGLFGGGYGGAIIGYANLDQIHLANVTLFAELGFLHTLYFMVGVLGKLGGWL